MERQQGERSARKADRSIGLGQGGFGHWMVRRGPGRGEWSSTHRVPLDILDDVELNLHCVEPPRNDTSVSGCDFLRTECGSASGDIVQGKRNRSHHVASGSIPVSPSPRHSRNACAASEASTASGGHREQMPDGRVRNPRQARRDRPRGVARCAPLSGSATVHPRIADNRCQPI